MKTSGRHGSIKDSPTCSGISYLSLRVYLPLTVDTGNHDSDKDEDAECDDEPLHFSCHSHASDLFTHASAKDLLYNLGCNVFRGSSDNMLLGPTASARWRALSKPKVQQKLTIKIPGGQHPSMLKHS
ncbi:hypothetical protein A0H81_03401 [Grifola frondosa]|uniref:Uncharacterized protein n=1 Tax=Grifola frondosa TaxID=5627 RepID=A0A1C7MJA9_GRIFR|nr:hypothetical protein A0H81_03401 [Grifola frondosa]